MRRRLRLSPAPPQGPAEAGTLRRLYDRAPAPLRRLAAPLRLLWGAPALLRKRLRRRTLELWRVEGRERSSGLPLAILCAASDFTKSYLLDLAFGELRTETLLGRVRPKEMAAAVRGGGRDLSLVVADVREEETPLLGLGDPFHIPGWLIGEVDLTDLEALRSNAGVRSDLRRIRKHGLRHEITRDPALFDEFYARMYVPFISRSHGATAYVMPYGEKRRRFASCELLLVLKGEERIGGTLIAYDEAAPRLWSLGVRDGDPAHLDCGVVGATIHFGLGHLAGRGHRTAGLGMSRPFLRDGALRYKSKWSQRIVRTWPSGFALKVLTPSPAARAFLCNNPFVRRSGGELVSTVFVNAGVPLSEAERGRILRECSHPGVSRIDLREMGDGGILPVPAAGTAPARAATREGE